MTKVKELPSAERLNELFDYHSETGNLIRKVRTNSRTQIGEVAGSLNKTTGYVTVRIDGTPYLAHRLIYTMLVGDIPTGMFIDHADNNPSNNRIGNLGLATNAQNQQNKSLNRNNTSGFKGVSCVKTKNKFRTQLLINGKNTCLGSFNTAEEAYLVRCSAANQYHGDFANFG